MATQYPRFPQLPAEVRLNIIHMAVNESVDKNGLPEGTRVVDLNLDAQLNLSCDAVDYYGSPQFTW